MVHGEAGVPHHPTETPHRRQRPEAADTFSVALTQPGNQPEEQAQAHLIKYDVSDPFHPHLVARSQQQNFKAGRHCDEHPQTRTL